MLFRIIANSPRGKYHMVYLDETTFQIRYNQEKVWSNKGQQVVVEAPKRFQKNQSVIAALDVNGVKLHMLLDGYLEGTQYLEFLQRIKDHYKGRRNLVIFYDGLSVHKRPDAFHFIRDQGWTGVLNCAYDSPANPIEYVFSQIKLRFR